MSHDRNKADSAVVIVGRAEIANQLGRSERTVTRWIRRGLLPVKKAGPFDNSLLRVCAADLERLAGWIEPGKRPGA